MFPRIRRGKSIIRTFPQKKREDKKEAFLKCDTKIPSLPGKTFFFLSRERARAASAYPSHYSVVSSCAVFPGCPAKKYKKKFPPSSCLSPSPPLLLYIYQQERRKVRWLPNIPPPFLFLQRGGRRRPLYPLITFLLSLDPRRASICPLSSPTSPFSWFPAGGGYFFATTVGAECTTQICIIRSKCQK